MLQVRSTPESPIWPQANPEARLLIVDDEPNIRSPLVRVLSLLGYCVEEAGSGHEALALLEHKSHDLMVLDMHMPGMDGVEVMHRARQLHPELLIIILTGYATLENAIAAVKLEAVDYLRKPASAREIADAVTRTLTKRAQRIHRQRLVHILGQTLDALRQPETLSTPPSPSETSPVPSSPKSETHSEHFMRIYPLALDCKKRLVTVENNPTYPVALTKGETVVLASLMARPNRVLSCRQLVRSAWGYHHVDADEAESVIRPYIFRLRRKLETNPKKPDLICTVRRRGYSFVPPS